MDIRTLEKYNAVQQQFVCVLGRRKEIGRNGINCIPMIRMRLEMEAAPWMVDTMRKIGNDGTEGIANYDSKTFLIPISTMISHLWLELLGNHAMDVLTIHKNVIGMDGSFESECSSLIEFGRTNDFADAKGLTATSRDSIIFLFNQMSNLNIHVR